MSSKKAATADSDEESSQMSGEDHTQNVFSTDNSFEQNVWDSVSFNWLKSYIVYFLTTLKVQKEW